MLYTSYFAKADKLRRLGYIPVAISNKCPNWWTGLYCQDLGPSDELLRGYKDGTISEEEYANIYNKYLNDNKEGILSLINVWYNRRGAKVVFLCYESPDKFCHRHLLSKFLNDNGIPCEEVTNWDEENNNG